MSYVAAVANGSQDLRPPLVAVLENIRSMGNVGSIFRSADGAGVDRLLLCGFTPHPPRKEIDKTALGATDVIPWEYWTRAADACRWLRAQGYRVVGLERNGESSSLASHPVTGPTAFVVGHEVEGIQTSTLEHCHEVRHIPMAGTKESLNVAVAFGIAAYALRGQLNPAPASEVHPPSA